MTTSPEQLAAHFVRRDADLKSQAKQLAPIRKERKELHDHLLRMFEDDPSLEQITLGDGTVVRLKTSELAAPVKEEYVAERLVEILGLAAPQATEVARRIWEERPKNAKHKLVYEGAGGAAGSGAAAGAAGQGRKRGRKD
jgi:hypothetical protein